MQIPEGDLYHGKYALFHEPDLVKPEPIAGDGFWLGGEPSQHKTRQNMKKYYQELRRKWAADTPLIAKWIKRTAGTVAVSIIPIWDRISDMHNVSFPAWVGYVVAGIAGIAFTIAGLKEVKQHDDPEQ